MKAGRSWCPPGVLSIMDRIWPWGWIPYWWKSC